MGRIYMAEIDIASGSALLDIFEITAGAEHPVALHEFLVTTDIETDANEIQLQLRLARWKGAFTGGSGGTLNVSAYPVVSEDAADTATVDVGNTTEISGGTEEQLGVWYCNNRIGVHHIFTPESRPSIVPTDALALTLLTTPTSTAFGGYVIYEELI